LQFSQSYPCIYGRSQVRISFDLAKFPGIKWRDTQLQFASAFIYVSLPSSIGMPDGKRIIRAAISAIRGDSTIFPGRRFHEPKLFGAAS